MSAGFHGLFGLSAGGGAGTSQPPATAGLVQWDLWTWGGLALPFSVIGIDVVREDRSDNRLYLRTERLAQTTARPGDVIFSAILNKPGWILCDGTSTVGKEGSGATYEGVAYRNLWEALAVGINWDNGQLVTLPSNPLPASGLVLLIKL